VDFLISQEIIRLIILGIILLIGLLAMKIIFRLTMSIIRIGSLVIFLIFIGVALLMVLN
jgi:hypothetical protein